ncbi:MAG TPA: sigma-70 family RNA polymerase sigma factor, partial [Chloroflexota bacterium]|nr:sigma-70 family RNA polymerase sigma factor [Chloroflexota bacterium]
MINLHEYKDRQAAIAATTDAATRDELVVKYMPLVHYVVRSLALSLPPMLDTEDVVSYGVMGLIDAIDRFDATRGVKFETYAVTRIRGYIIDQLRILDWIPRSARQRARQIERTHDAMEREMGRAPTADEVARHLGLDRGKYDQALRDATCITLSLDALLHPDEESLSGGLLQVV